MDERKNTTMSDEQLTQELKSHNSASKAAGIVMVIGIILMIIGIIGFTIPLIVAGLLIAIIAGVIRNGRKSTIKKQLSDNLVKSALEDVFDNVIYEPFKAMPSSLVWESDMMLPVSFNTVEGSDHIKASYKGLDIEMGDVSLVDSGEIYNDETQMYEKVESTVFRGQWLVCDFGRELVSDVKLAARSRADRALKKASIKTENEEFNKRFTIVSDNEQEAFYILI